MSQMKTALERAFELAGSGTLTRLTELRLRLRTEGFDDRQLEGPQLLRQLRGLMIEQHQPRDPDGERLCT